MTRRTWGLVKGEIARVAGQAGMSVADSRLMAVANAAIEELMTVKDWPSVIDRLDFKVYGGSITLPYAYERMLYATVNNFPTAMQSPWFEFFGYGPDLIQNVPPNQLDDSWNFLQQLAGTLDKDEVCTFLDIPNPSLGTFYTLMVSTTADERVNGAMPANIIIEGLDGNGDPIRTQDNSGNFINGVSIPWVQSGSLQRATSPQVFSQITRVLKPSTKEPLNCYMTPVGQTAYTQIARWEADVTCPVYRRYKINGLTSTTQYTIRCRCRRRFQPITGDNDFLLISNLPALKKMIMAVNYSESNNEEDYVSYRTNAVSILSEEARAYVGMQRQKPAVTMGEGAGVRQDGIYIV